MRNSRLDFLLGVCFCLLLSLHPAMANPVTGVYRITPRVQTGMCLDVSGFGNADGTNVLIWTANKTSNQQWRVEKQADGTYKIYAYSGRNSLEMLDLTNGTAAVGNPVRTWGDNGGNTQLWYFSPVGSGWYRIIPKNAGSTSALTLEIAGGSGAIAGSLTQIGTYTGGYNQMFRLDWAGPSKLYVNPKKGLGGRETKAASMNCSWYYTWGGGKPADSPSKLEFVPMEWGYYGNANNGSVNWLNATKNQPGVTTMLAFNEPDHTDQSNLTVAYALEGYQYMAALGIPIGSPACADDSSQWMKDFMSGAASRGYRVDYVCVHNYSRDAQGFLNYIDYIHNLYGKPLWITEFAPADWSGTNPVSTTDAANFMRTVVPALNNLWYVQRYAWYTGASPGPWTLGSAALVNDDGTLTDLGKLYSRM